MKPEDYKNTKEFVASLISALIYAIIIEISKHLSLDPADPSVQINLAIFVPAVTAIIFGKTVGAMSAGGGQLFSMIANSLMGNTDASLSNLSNIFLLLGNIFGGWTVGALRQKPERVQWMSFKARFTSIKTWQRIGGNTVSAIVGIGLTGSFVEGFSSYVIGHDTILNSTTLVIGKFFISSVLLLIVVPIALIFYEISDAFVSGRLKRIEMSLRRLFYNSIKEDLVAVISAELPERSFTKGVWTPVKIRFKNTTNKKTRFRIELISTSRVQPSYITTKEVAPGEILHQTFFVLPLERNIVELKARFTEYSSVKHSTAKSIKDTILEIRGRSYDPQNSMIVLGIYSVSNFLTVGASIIWSNIVKIINTLKNLSFNDFLATIQKHTVYLGLVTGIETVLFVPLIFLMRWEMRRLSHTLRHEAYFGVKETTQRYIFKLKDAVSNLTREVRKSIKMYINVSLVFITVISVFILGVEGYRAFTDPTYNILYPNDLMWLIVAVFLSWLIGLKGIDILKEVALIQKNEYIIQDIGPVVEFKPQKPPVKGEPNEFSLTIRNPLETHGLRLQITGMDAISPSIVELPVSAGKECKFKILVTPSDTGLRDILITSYPLFNKEGKYLNLNEAEALYHQHLRYKVKTSSGVFGLSKQQQALIKRIGELTIAGGSILFVSSAVLQKTFAGVDVISIIRDLSPIIIAIQFPFVYIYYYIKNRYRKKLFLIKEFVDRYSPVDINQFEKLMSDDLIKAAKTQLTSYVKTKLDGIIRSEIDESLIDEINKLVEHQVEQLLLKTGKLALATIEAEVNNIVADIITDTLKHKMKKEYSKKVESLVTQYKKKWKEKSLDDSSFKEAVTKEVKQAIMAELRGKIEQKLRKEKSKLKTQIREKLEKELKGKLKKQIKREVRKVLIKQLEPKIQKGIEKQVETGIVDYMLAELEEKIDNIISTKLAQQLKEKLTDRRFAMELAEELDKRLSSNFLLELEKTLGTSIEGETIAGIQESFVQMVTDRVKDKTRSMLRKKIKKQIKKHLKKTVRNIVENKLTGMLEKSIDKFMDSLTSRKLERIITEITDRQCNIFLETILADVLR